MSDTPQEWPNDWPIAAIQKIETLEGKLDAAKLALSDEQRRLGQLGKAWRDWKAYKGRGGHGDWATVGVEQELDEIADNALYEAERKAQEDHEAKRGQRIADLLEQNSRLRHQLGQEQEAGERLAKEVRESAPYAEQLRSALINLRAAFIRRNDGCYPLQGRMGNAEMMDADAALDQPLSQGVASIEDHDVLPMEERAEYGQGVAPVLICDSCGKPVTEPLCRPEPHDQGHAFNLLCPRLDCQRDRKCHGEGGRHLEGNAR